mmetsp:Transcript_7293/g.12550  ORF Transcript_7293/g.12550 Transcript_7293/m.12550 type:complete len:468 (+) Transcript_7293:1364-2767(+)
MHRLYTVAVASALPAVVAAAPARCDQTAPAPPVCGRFAGGTSSSISLDSPGMVTASSLLVSLVCPGARDASSLSDPGAAAGPARLSTLCSSGGEVSRAAVVQGVPSTPSPEMSSRARLRPVLTSPSISSTPSLELSLGLSLWLASESELALGRETVLVSGLGALLSSSVSASSSSSSRSLLDVAQEETSASKLCSSSWLGIRCDSGERSLRHLPVYHGRRAAFLPAILASTTSLASGVAQFLHSSASSPTTASLSSLPLLQMGLPLGLAQGEESRLKSSPRLKSGSRLKSAPLRLSPRLGLADGLGLGLELRPGATHTGLGEWLGLVAGLGLGPEDGLGLGLEVWPATGRAGLGDGLRRLGRAAGGGTSSTAAPHMLARKLLQNPALDLCMVRITQVVKEGSWGPFADWATAGTEGGEDLPITAVLIFSPTSPSLKVSLTWTSFPDSVKRLMAISRVVPQTPLSSSP